MHNTSKTNTTYLNTCRHYRKLDSPHKDEQKLQILIEETDLLITLPKDMDTEKAAHLCFQFVEELRKELKEYICIYPNFQHSLTPIGYKADAPHLIKAMCDGAAHANVGPFAAVAGSISQLTCLMLVAWIQQERQKTQENQARQEIQESQISQKIQKTEKTSTLIYQNHLENINVIVENGGDIYMYTQKERVVGILSNPTEGESIGLRICPSDSPVSLCSSSSKIGHSLSFGNGDIAMVRAKNAALADALATAYCNMLKSSKDIDRVIEQAQKDAQIKIPHNPFNNNEILAFLKKYNVDQSSPIKEDIVETPYSDEKTHSESELAPNNETEHESGLEGVFLQCDGHIGAWGKIELVAL